MKPTISKFTMKQFLFVFLFLTTFQSVFAQQDKGKSLGNFVLMTKEKQNFSIQTDYGNVQVQIYSSTIFRLKIWGKTFVSGPDYALVGQPLPTTVKTKETKDAVVIQTDSLTLQISKFPVRFIFKTPDGAIVNTEDVMGTYWLNGQVFAFKKLHQDEKFVGLGEKTGHLNRRGSGYTNWNTDNPHYEDWDDPLYASIPFYIGIHSGLNYGIFLNNTTRTRFNFGAGNNRVAYFSAEDEQLDYFFIYRKKISAIITDYSFLTGRIKIPPVWSLGFQQCRWSYTPDKEVMEVATAFHDKQIPLDVLYLDIGYMDAYKVFTWNPKTFSQPGKLVNNLKNLGIHTMVIIDPGIKVEKGYPVYEEGVKNNYFIKYPDGTNYSGQVWPGWCNFPDFTNQTVRLWWGEQFKILVDDGVTGFWNDMNEIAVWGKVVPPVVRLNWEGMGSPYTKAKNVYGMLMARSTYEGTKKLLNGKRPLILTRAGFAGLQRYSAIWTGDNQATDNHMLLGIRLVNSFGLSGIPFAGYDVGGFGGNASPGLYVRWVSLGTFSPFFRVHSSITTKRSEPWSYGVSAERIAKRFIELRYHLLPYIYSAFYAASQTGIPVQRSLSIAYTQDEKVFDPQFENQYLFGPFLLVIPAKSTQTIVKAWLPEGHWYSFYDDDKINGPEELLTESPLDKLPVFVKEGAIIPIQKLVQNTGINPGDTLEIHLYCGNVTRSFVYYEDDGNTYNYENGSFYKRTITYKGKANYLVFSKSEGNFTSKFKIIRLIFHGFDENITDVDVNGKSKKLLPVTKSYLNNYQTLRKALSVDLSNSNREIKIDWHDTDK